ncbi:MAG: threonine ammonia-lyase [Clostridia bacterium]|nr:threonine ammonia-lyase [Clostridia bacterium]MBO4886436.1 threonine ammonia-lyase [Clostridia bacterium]MBR4443192.1 threonine ammonia-lyase [Clostridia bacterium]
METVSLGMILEARERLKKAVRSTDLVPSQILAIPGKREVFLKTECLQYTGSFKLRGAYNRISMLTPEERGRGVIASSAGNHAQGVALAAAKFGAKATIVMPAGAPLAKVAATRSYGAEVVLHGAVYDDAYAEACRIQEESGAVFVHPFNDPYVVAGQGSIGLEIMDANPDIDTVVVPIGGGGMASGIAAAVKLLHPEVKVVGVQAAGAPSMLESMRAGRIVTLKNASTIADGIAVKTPGDLTFAMCEKYLDEVVTVEEDEIAGAILMLLEKCKIVAEGAGAASVAAVMYEKFDTAGKVACVVSGGNIDVTTLQRILDQGLMKSGRMVRIHTVIQDRPGHLARLLAVISESGANVVSIQHDRTSSSSGIGMALLDLLLETNDFEHLSRVHELMKENGYPVM